MTAPLDLEYSPFLIARGSGCSPPLLTSHDPRTNTCQGKFLIDSVIPKNFPPPVNCYSSGGCTGEIVWSDTNAFNDTVNEMSSNCVPNHQ